MSSIEGLIQLMTSLYIKYNNNYNFNNLKRLGSRKRGFFIEALTGDIYIDPLGQAIMAFDRFFIQVNNYNNKMIFKPGWKLWMFIAGSIRFINKCRKLIYRDIRP